MCEPTSPGTSHLDAAENLLAGDPADVAVATGEGGRSGTAWSLSGGGGQGFAVVLGRVT